MNKENNKLLEKNEITLEMIKQLPKTDLHVHLDGSLRIPTILELAEKQKINLPTTDPDKLKKILIPGTPEKGARSLEKYLESFNVTLSVLQTTDALSRTAYELAEDAAAENVRYMEIRYSPILHVKKGLRLTQIQDAVWDGLIQAEKDFDIKTGIIICGMRNIDPDISLTLAELSVAYKNRGVVAFDLAGEEYNYPAKDHQDAFFLILRNNINCTLHAGEGYGPDSIHQAIHYCGAHRIGHGVRLKEDGDLLNYVNDHRIPLEVCLTSNVQTGAINTLEDHPLRFYFDYGLRVTINTDSRLVSDTTVSDELNLAVKNFNFTLQELEMLIINGFKSTFLPYREKVKILDKAILEMREITKSAVKAREQYVRVSP